MKSKPGIWEFWAQWVVVNAVALVLGSIIAGRVYLTKGWNSQSIQVLTTGAVAGASFGILQWCVLHRYIEKAGWWILSNVVGFALGFSLVNPLQNYFRTTGDQIIQGMEGLMLYGVVLNIPVGVMQWLVLRQSVSKASLWIPAYVLGITSSWIVYPGVAMITQSVNQNIYIYFMLVGITTGTLTGIPLVMLLRQSKEKFEIASAKS